MVSLSGGRAPLGFTERRTGVRSTCRPIPPYSGRYCVTSLESSYAGFYPQTPPNTNSRGCTRRWRQRRENPHRHHKPPIIVRKPASSAPPFFSTCVNNELTKRCETRVFGDFGPKQARQRAEMGAGLSQRWGIRWCGLPVPDLACIRSCLYDHWI